MQSGAQSLLSRRRFDVDDYHRMARAGILPEDDRVELLDGEIVRMTPIGSRHASCVERLCRMLMQRVGDRAWVRIQNPVRLGPYSEPEPDVALLRLRADDYALEHPAAEDTLLVIEIAESSLDIDRTIKLPLYAAAGIGEVWIVDLSTDRIELYRRPREGAYESRRAATSGTVSPLAFPDLEIAIEEIVPARG